jgi:hypothetical protein
MNSYKEYAYWYYSKNPMGQVLAVKSQGMLFYQVKMRKQVDLTQHVVTLRMSLLYRTSMSPSAGVCKDPVLLDAGPLPSSTWAD